MPNVLTHYLHAEDVKDGLGSRGYISDCVEAFPKEFSIGSSGPDFLFYYDVFPWQNGKKNKSVASYGGMVHKEKINEFYQRAIELCQRESDTPKKTAMISFLAGHLCHWALDSTAHPMIFYRTNGTTKETKYWHYRYESMIDTYMAEYKGKIPLKNYPTSKIVKYDKKTVKAISAIYSPISAELWNIDVEEKLIEKSLHDFRSVNRFLFNPNNYFFYLMQALETMGGVKWIFSSHMIIGKKDMKHDILNENHHKWNNPSDLSIVSHESFIDLYNKAITKAVTAVQLLEQAIQNNSVQELLEFIDNRSYETGLPVFKKMQYYNSIY